VDGLKIGDKVKASSLMRKVNNGAKVSWVKMPYKETGLFLGWTYVQNGEWDGYLEERYFVPIQRVRVAVLQPLSGNRYRRPVHALGEDIEIIDEEKGSINQ